MPHFFLPFSCQREEAMRPYLYLASHAHMHTHGTNERDGGNARERRRLNGMMGRGKRERVLLISKVGLVQNPAPLKFG